MDNKVGFYSGAFFVLNITWLHQYPILESFCLGAVGGVGGMIAQHLYKKFIKK
jgi:hypothetical protein